MLRWWNGWKTKRRIRKFRKIPLSSLIIWIKKRQISFQESSQSRKLIKIREKPQVSKEWKNLCKNWDINQLRWWEDEWDVKGLIEIQLQRAQTSTIQQRKQEIEKRMISKSRWNKRSYSVGYFSLIYYFFLSEDNERKEQIFSQSLNNSLEKMKVGDLVSACRD